MNKYDLIKHLANLDIDDQPIAWALWTPEDVWYAFDNLDDQYENLPMSEEIAEEAIRRFDQGYDSNYGLTWENLEAILIDLLYEQSKKDEEENRIQAAIQNKEAMEDICF